MNIGFSAMPPRLGWTLLPVLGSLACWAWYTTWTGPVAELSRQRQMLSEAEQLLQNPSAASLLPQHQVIHADSASLAGEELRHRLMELAGSHGLMVEEARLRRSGAYAPMVMVRLHLSGPEPLMRRFIARVERGQTVIRFANWSLASIAGGSLRLEADAAALWSPAAPSGVEEASQPATPRLLPQPAGQAEHQGRRLFTGTAGTPLGIDPASGAPELLGVAGRTSNAVALVRAADGSVHSLSLGNSIDGWKLVAVGSDGALFDLGGLRQRVPLPLMDGGA